MNPTQWLAQARELHAASFGPQSGPILITVRDQAGNSLSWETAGIVASAAPMFSPTEAEIVRVIGSGALKGAAVASRLGRAYDAGLKVLLANMVERGVLEKTDGGYQNRTSPTDQADQS